MQKGTASDFQMHKRSRLELVHLNWAPKFKKVSKPWQRRVNVTKTTPFQS